MACLGGKELPREAHYLSWRNVRLQLASCLQPLGRPSCTYTLAGGSHGNRHVCLRLNRAFMRNGNCKLPAKYII